MVTGRRTARAGDSGPGRWRALLGLLVRADRGRAAWLGTLVLAVGLLSPAVILATGALVAAIPAAVEHGLASAGGAPALRALAALAAALALLVAAGNALGQVARELDAAFALEVHGAVARVTLGTPGIAPLDDPALADRLQAVRDAERRGVLRDPATELSTLAVTRLRGVGAFALLLAFRWWAPLVLAAAWQLTNRLYWKATENGVSVGMDGGAPAQRRAEYLRALALQSPAAKEIRVFGLGEWVVGRYGEAWTEALGVLWRSRRANRAGTAAAVLALAAAHAAVLGALALAAGRGDVSAAALLVFVQAALATSDLGLVGDAQWWVAQSRDVAERVAGLPRCAEEPDAEAPARPAGGTAAEPAGRTGMALRLEGVRFTYRGRTAPTLDGVTLDVPAGQSLAVVGENGAGKSTLIKLLCGLYEPDAGRIILGGDASPLQARGRVGVIFQDFVRYPLSLRENVGFGHLPLLGDGDALERALRDAGGGDLPRRLPRGWHTPLSRELTGGAELSGGQWQRVALARALAAVRGGAGLLILDEPTASLDVRAEADLFQRFLDVTRGVTTILVSHRLSSVRRADRIVVVEGGRVVEDGPHDELVRAGGRYAAMFSLQAERFARGADADTGVGVEVADG